MQVGAAAAPAALAQETPYGALAVDEVQGYHFGFAHDHGNQVDADRRATEECQEAGGTSCRVVLLWSGAGCGAYRSVTEGGYAYGWGVAGTRAASETIAERELMAGSSGRMAQNQAWACNGKLEGYGKYYDTSGNLVYDGRWSNNQQVD